MDDIVVNKAAIERCVQRVREEHAGDDSVLARDSVDDMHEPVSLRLSVFPTLRSITGSFHSQLDFCRDVTETRVIAELDQLAPLSVVRHPHEILIGKRDAARYVGHT